MGGGKEGRGGKGRGECCEMPVPGGPPGRTRRLAGPAQARRAARRRAGQLMNKDATLKECNKHNKTIKEDKINTIKEE